MKQKAGSLKECIKMVNKYKGLEEKRKTQINNRNIKEIAIVNFMDTKWIIKDHE